MLNFSTQLPFIGPCGKTFDATMSRAQVIQLYKNVSSATSFFELNSYKYFYEDILLLIDLTMIFLIFEIEEETNTIFLKKSTLLFLKFDLPPL